MLERPDQCHCESRRSRMHKKPTTRGSQQRLTQTRGSKERFKELHAQLFNKFPRELLIALELEDPKDFLENPEELEDPKDFLEKVEEPQELLIALELEDPKDFLENFEEPQNIKYFLVKLVNFGLRNLKELQDPRSSLIARLREAHLDQMAGTGFRARWVESNRGKGMRTDDCAMIPEFSR